MPKRMVRTAAQIAASRRNLIAARKAKSRKTIPRSDYSGKISVYHRTSHEAANSILKNGFSTANRRTGQKAEAFFSTEIYSGSTGLYGPAVVKARLSPSTLRRHGWSYKPSLGNVKKGETWHSLPVSHLAGTKLKRKLITVSERKPGRRRNA